ncbi:MAG: hypothetical protein RR646_00790 [Erysipelotrichaceae bacterium]
MNKFKVALLSSLLGFTIVGSNVITASIIQSNMDEKISESVHEQLTLVNNKGDNGPVGPKGDAGINGINGTNGEQGLNGLRGPQGVPGSNGVDGKDGKDGKDGIDGIQGLTGQSGLQGVPGKNGTDGADGTDGKNLLVKNFNAADATSYNLGDIIIYNNEVYIIIKKPVDNRLPTEKYRQDGTGGSTFYAMPGHIEEAYNEGVRANARLDNMA